MEVPKNILTSMRQLVDYVYEDEEKDYEEIKEDMDDPTAHIFEIIKQIDEFLTKHGIE